MPLAILAEASDLLDGLPALATSHAAASYDYDEVVAPAVMASIRAANAANAGGASSSEDLLDGEANSEAIDVTVPVQCLVEDNSRYVV